MCPSCAQKLFVALWCDRLLGLLIPDATGVLEIGPEGAVPVPGCMQKTIVGGLMCIGGVPPTHRTFGGRTLGGRVH